MTRQTGGQARQPGGPGPSISSRLPVAVLPRVTLQRRGECLLEALGSVSVACLK